MEPLFRGLVRLYCARRARGGACGSNGGGAQGDGAGRRGRGRSVGRLEVDSRFLSLRGFSNPQTESFAVCVLRCLQPHAGHSWPVSVQQDTGAAGLRPLRHVRSSLGGP